MITILMDTYIQILVYEASKIHLQFISLSIYRQLADPATSAPNIGLTPWPVRVAAKCIDKGVGAGYRAWVCIDRTRHRSERACTSTIHEFVTDVSHWLGRTDTRVIFIRYDITLTEPMSIAPGDPLLRRVRKWLDLRLMEWIPTPEGSHDGPPPDVKKRRIHRDIHGDDAGEASSDDE
jgi:hypothetical protein